MKEDATSEERRNLPVVHEYPSVLARAAHRFRAARSVLRITPFETDSAAGRSLERYRRIALTSVTGLGVRMFGTVTGLVTVPLLLGYLGKERYGLWSALTTLVSWIALFDFGVSNGLVNAVSSAHGRDDRSDARQYVATAFSSLILIALVLLALLAVAGPLVKWDAVFAAKGVYDTATLARCAVAAVAVFVTAMPLSIVPQIYAGYQRAYVANGFTLLGTILGFAGLLLAVRWRLSMPALIVVFGSGTLLSSTCALLYARYRAMPWLTLLPSSATMAALRGLVSRSLPIFLFQVGALAVNQTQSLVLAHRCDLHAVAEYGILMRVYLLLASLIQLSTASFLPTFREARERGDHEWMRRGFARFVALRTLFAMTAAVCLVIGGNAFLELWLRSNDVRFEWAVWAVLGLLLVASTWVTAHGELLTIMDRLWVQVVLVLINGALTLSLTYLWAPRMRVLGVVLGTGAVTILLYSWVVPLLARGVLRKAPARSAA